MTSGFFAAVAARKEPGPVSVDPPLQRSQSGRGITFCRGSEESESRHDPRLSASRKPEWPAAPGSNTISGCIQLIP